MTRFALLVVVALAAIVGVILLGVHGQHWIAVHTGTVNEAGPYYGFWSGFGSDLSELTLIAAIITPATMAVRKMNCGAKGCWRPSRHEYDMDGVKHSFCRRHHPHPSTNAPITAQQIKDHYARTHPEETT
jgi:hypothetical protein